MNKDESVAYLKKRIIRLMKMETDKPEHRDYCRKQITQCEKLILKLEQLPAVKRR